MSGIRTIEDLRIRCRMIPSTHKTKTSDCWEWPGATESRTGGPSIWIPAIKCAGAIGTLVSVLKTGQRCPAGMVYMVACGTKNCCNPDHRKWETKSALTRKIHEGTTLSPSHKARITATRRAGSVITEEVLQKLRAHPVGESIEQLADEVGLSRSYAAAIKAGRRRPAEPSFSVGGAAASVFSWRPA